MNTDNWLFLTGLAGGWAVALWSEPLWASYRPSLAVFWTLVTLYGFVRQYIGGRR